MLDQPIIWEAPAPSIERVESWRIQRNGMAPGDSLTGQDARDCPAGLPGEIVVCAPNPEAERLKILPEVTQSLLPRAQVRLSDSATLGVDMQSEELPGGVISKRVMIGTKIRF